MAKVHSLWQVHFELPIQFVLTLAFDWVVFMEMLHFHSRNSELKTVLKFLRKVLVFQKTCFKVKILKTFKIPGDYYIKTWQSLKRWLLHKNMPIY